MALIKCTECGREISDKALACPNCGCPVEKERICAECGQTIPNNASECPNCGCPQKTVEASKSNDRMTAVKSPNKINYNKIVIVVLTAILVVIGFSRLSNDIENDVSDEISRSVSDEKEEKTLDEKIKEAKTIEEIKELIDGTTWHYTENTSNSQIGFWIKVEFKDGYYTNYYASPSDGKWTLKGQGVYKIEEGRFSNSGEKYIAVKWEGGGYNGWPSKFALIPANCQLAVTSAVPSLDRLNNPYKIEEPSYGIMEFGDYSWN